MKRLTTMVLAVMAGAMLAVRGAALCEGESAVTTVDLTPGVRTAAASESIQYSSVWTTSVLSGPKAVVKVCPVKSEKPKYIAIDLSGGPSATHYPIECLDEVPGGEWSDEYKTSKLVLRHIPAGSFVMGGRATDYPGSVNTNLHMVTLTKDFYMGVFEVTQRQWELVMGDRPSAFSNETCYATRPVEMVSYVDIRGGEKGITWPESKDVDDASFMGVLRRKTEISAFDLPTEAQWEYSCRAGTTTALYSGYNICSKTNEDAAVSEIARYEYNSGTVDSSWTYASDLRKGTAPVGTYKANGWGLYDMLGNVWEHCIDGWTEQREGDVDPVGSLPSSRRTNRGGGWKNTAVRCLQRGGDPVDSINDRVGLRLCLHGGEIPELNEATVLVNAAGEGTTTWTPPMKAGRYYLTHETQTNGVNGAELLGALFEVEGPELTFAADGELVPGVKVTIGGVGDGWTVRYEVTAMDGGGASGGLGTSRPTSESPIYTEAITLEESAVVRAVAFSNDGFESREFSATFSLMNVACAVARPRYPWNGKVDVDVTVKGDDDLVYLVSLAAQDVDGGTNLPLRTAWLVGGDATNNVFALPPGTYRFTWDADADIDGDVDIANIAVSVSVEGGATAEATKVLALEVAGYEGEETLADVPVLVRLSSAINGFSYDDCADANGGDIVFTDESGSVVYPHEIDEWNTNGESLVWVKLPQMINGTKFKMGYGSLVGKTVGAQPMAARWGQRALPGDGGATQAAAVWSDYAGVWHMNEDSGTAFDSTAHGLDAMPSYGVNGNATTLSEMVAYANGACGNARVNDAQDRTDVAAQGSGNSMLVPNYNALSLGETFVVSGWFYLNAMTNCPRLVSRKTKYTSSDGWEIQFSSVPTAIGVRGAANTPNVGGVPIPSVLTGWRYIAVVYDGTNASCYADGILASSGEIAPATDNGLSLAIGGNANGSEYTIFGQYDEIRLRGGSLSADRIKADYDMINNRDFLQYGPVANVQDTEWGTDAAVITTTADAFRLSVKHDGIRTSAGHETLAYSLLWGDAGEGATVTIEQGGVVIAEGLTGEGVLPWNVAHNGTYVLMYKVMSGDAQIGETMTATFFVEPEDPVISPESGTTFGTSLTVTMSCPTEGATIHYTLDGTDPTADSPVYRRFRINERTTVKAVAEKNGMLSEIVVAEYAPGRCVDPVFSLADGAEFAHSNQVVSIRWNNDGVLRYTLNGTDPTAESPIYEGPFAISDSVELRAKVFSDEFFESSVVTASLTRIWENAATPIIDGAESFTGSKTKVVITCATPGAAIYYTLDGSEPTEESHLYTVPIYVTESCTVRARAVLIDYLDSFVAAKEITKIWGIGDSLGKPDHGFTTGTNELPGWYRVEDASAPGGEAMRSGAITHGQSSVLSTTVMGPGTLSFSWRTSCEEDPDYHEWDHAELAVDSNVVLKLDGVVAWTNASVRIEDDGEHAVEWRYVKDEAESEGDDAAYVAGYGWASDLTETQTTEVHVPYSWLLTHDPEIVDEYDAYESAAKLTGENGYKVWESYIIGANPNDKDDFLKITAFPMKADGSPDFDAIMISPPQTQWNVQGAAPVLKGKATLEGAGEWQTVTDENKADMRFFKVEVVLP